MSRRWTALVVALLAAFLGTQSAGAAPQGRFNPPKAYYLALGDSLTFGYQHALFQQELGSGTYDPADFPGFVEPFAADMRAARPGLRVENLGCPGETSGTFFATCPTPNALLHVTYPGSQMDAALAFLAEHPGQVSPITIGLGANDLLRLQATCQATYGNDLALFAACVQAALPGILETVAGNLDTALTALRTAAPGAEIIVMDYYNPEPWFPLAAPALQALDGTIAQVAAADHDRLADVYTPFAQAPAGGFGTLLPLDLDVHPTTAGYGVMADAFWSASGYERLLD